MYASCQCFGDSLRLRYLILHTLGCVYAELGQTKQARELLVQAMDIKGADELEDAFWLAFGRIAEQYGKEDLAKLIIRECQGPSGKRTFRSQTTNLRRCGSSH